MLRGRAIRRPDGGPMHRVKKCSAELAQPILKQPARPANIRCSDTPSRFWRIHVVSQSPVAQLVEQAAVNRPVAGSSPAGGAFLDRAETGLS